MKLITHIVAGYPNLAFSKELISCLSTCGSDYIEIQIPFSDPLADGPVIMKANQIALDNGFRVADTFTLLKELKKNPKYPLPCNLLLMCYYNTIFNHGLERFVSSASKEGIFGLIVPDLPLEEAAEYFQLCQKYSIKPIYVIAPNTPDQRLLKIKKIAQGFIYLMARFGVTGSKTEFSNSIKQTIKRVKKIINLPVAVGFGIKSKDQIAFLKGHADMAVIGSAILEEIFKSKNEADALNKVTELIQKLNI